MPRQSLLKSYRPGDQINVAVTKDFAETATEFFHYCKKRQMNPSEVIRYLITEWLEEQRKIERLIKRGMGSENVLGKLVKDYEESVFRER